MIGTYFVKKKDPAVIAYLLLTKFEGRTVSYRPRVFPHRFKAQAQSCVGHKPKVTIEDP